MAGVPHPGVPGAGAAPRELPATLEAPVTGMPRAIAGEAGTAGRPRPPAARPRRDPRDSVDLNEFDVAGLTFIGQYQTVLQGQLAEACYPGRSEAVVSRRVKRWRKYKLVGVERFMAMGCNMLFLTERGVAALEDGGHASSKVLFGRTKPIAVKDLAHHLTIVDLAILAHRSVPFAASVIRPAWRLQRDIYPPPPAIPDLLLATRHPRGAGQVLLAYEVDTSSEPLKVFVPKLQILAGLLPDWADGGTARVCILTRGSGRAAALGRAVADLGVEMAVVLLPRATGRASLVGLAEVLSGSGGGL